MSNFVKQIITNDLDVTDSVGILKMGHGNHEIAVRACMVFDEETEEATFSITTETGTRVFKLPVKLAHWFTDQCATAIEEQFPELFDDNQDQTGTAD